MMVRGRRAWARAGIALRERVVEGSERRELGRWERRGEKGGKTKQTRGRQGDSRWLRGRCRLAYVRRRVRGRLWGVCRSLLWGRLRFAQSPPTQPRQMCRCLGPNWPACQTLRLRLRLQALACDGRAQVERGARKEDRGGWMLEGTSKSCRISTSNTLHQGKL